MDAARVMGQLLRHPEGALVGWCWSPDRPSDALTCEILADTKGIATVRADLWMQHLLVRGFGDGRHGFRLELPPGSTDGARLLTARESGTGTIVGRVRLPEPPPADRLLAIARSIEDLRESLSAQAKRPVPAGNLRHGFRRIGQRLGPARAADRFAIDVPPTPHPAASVVLLARDSARSAATLVALAPALSGQLGTVEAEFLLAPCGCDPSAALLPGTVLRGAEASTPSQALARALEVARGQRLVLLDDSEPSPSAAALAALLDDPAPLIVGPRSTSLAARLQPGSPLMMGAAPPGRLALLLAAGLALLRRLGGLDPALDGDPDAAIVDLCRKAALLGVEARGTPSLAGPVPPAAHRSDPAALAFLSARWGRARSLAQ